MPVSAAPRMPTRTRRSPKNAESERGVEVRPRDAPPLRLGGEGADPHHDDHAEHRQQREHAQMRRNPELRRRSSSRRTSVPVPGSVITSCWATPANAAVPISPMPIRAMPRCGSRWRNVTATSVGDEAGGEHGGDPEHRPGVEVRRPRPDAARATEGGAAVVVVDVLEECAPSGDRQDEQRGRATRPAPPSENSGARCRRIPGALVVSTDVAMVTATAVSPTSARTLPPRYSSTISESPPSGTAVDGEGDDDEDHPGEPRPQARRRRAGGRRASGHRAAAARRARRGRAAAAGATTSTRPTR